MSLPVHRFDVPSLSRLKDETAYTTERIPWNQISKHVVELVGDWEANYNLIRQFEVQMKFKFLGPLELIHFEMINQLYDYGRDILMVLSKVERDATPPIDLKESFDLLVKGLCALKISRRAFSPEPDISDLSPHGEAGIA